MNTFCFICFFVFDVIKILNVYLNDEHEFVVCAVQKFDAKFFEEKSNGKRRTTFRVEIAGGLTILCDFDRTLFLVEIDLRK